MTTSIRYDKTILKSAILAYIKKVYLKHLGWPSLLIIGLITYVFFCDSDWLQSFIIVTILMIPTILVLGYWMRIKQSLKILDLLDDGRIEISLDDKGLTTTSAIGQSQLKWKMFSELWNTPTAYLLLYTNNAFITLPKNQVSESFVDEIRKKINS